MKVNIDQGLDNLRMQLSDMAAKVEMALSSSVHSIRNLSREVAAQVISQDYIIDEFRGTIEEESVKLFTLCQPAERELRQMITIVKISGKLERVGNLAVDICERLDDMIANGDQNLDQLDFNDLSKNVYAMLHDALDALMYHDSQIAQKVIAADDVVDDIHHHNYERTLKLILNHPEHGNYYLDGLTISRCLERIADIATTIAEDVLYQEQRIKL